MGFKVSWIAARGIDRSTLLDRLGLVATGEPETGPYAELTGVILADGWYLVHTDDPDFIRDLDLLALARDAEIVACSVNESTMSSAAAGVRGADVWSVTHDNDRGRYDLTATGSLPAEYTSIREAQIAEQDHQGPSSNVDCIFDVPVELARALTGFRHDCPSPPDAAAWEILAPRAGYPLTR